MVTSLSPTAKSTRVSVRELKEESYRALRSSGYTWGEAQAAGRGYATAQVLWGSGVTYAINDARRRRVNGKSLRTSRVNGTIRLKDPRKTSDLISGAHAVSLSLALPKDTVMVSNRFGGREVGPAVWDLRTNNQPVTWGRRVSSTIKGYSIDEFGDMYWHESIPESLINAKLAWRSWFVRQTALPGGQLLVSHSDRELLNSVSYQQGVLVEPRQWEQLMKIAKNFLVAE